MLCNMHPPPNYKKAPHSPTHHLQTSPLSCKNEDEAFLTGLGLSSHNEAKQGSVERGERKISVFTDDSSINSY